MSESNAPSALDALRAAAKQTLALAKSGDGVVIAKLRTSLPKLSSVTDAEISANIQLADVQHALARQRGLKSWAELKRAAEAADPVQIQAVRFMHAVRGHDGKRAQQLLADSPAIASYSINTAAAACNSHALESFLQSDTSLATKVSAPDAYQPILYACGSPLVALDPSYMAESERCVALLLQYGADENASIEFGEEKAPLSALYFASASNNIGVVRRLLNAGANPNDGESIYHSAERNYRDVMRLLVDAGVDITNRSAGYDNTPLYFLAGHKPFSALCASSELGMKWLMENGADPNVQSYIADRYRSWPSSGETPLHRVAEFGKGVDIAAALVEHRADVNVQRTDGRTAYSLAVRTGNAAVAEFLVKNGADASTLTDIDRLLGACALADTVLAKRIVADNPDIVSRLSQNDRRVIARAVEDGNTESVRLMLELGWNVTEEGEWGGTPLHLAAWFGRPDITRVLLGEGAPVNVRDSQFGSSPIAWAAHGSVNGRPGHDDAYAAIVEMLLDAGASREASYNKGGEPPEALASSVIARLLRARGFAA